MNNTLKGNCVGIFIQHVLHFRKQHNMFSILRANYADFNNDDEYCCGKTASSTWL